MTKNYIAYRGNLEGTETLILGIFKKKKFALFAVIEDEKQSGITAHIEEHNKFSTVNTGKYLYIIRPLSKKENQAFLRKCDCLKKYLSKQLKN